MPQVDRWYYPIEGEPFTIVECPRRDCDQQAKAYSFDGPWEPWLPDEPVVEVEDHASNSWIVPRREVVGREVKVLVSLLPADLHQQVQDKATVEGLKVSELVQEALQQ